MSVVEHSIPISTFFTEGDEPNTNDAQRLLFAKFLFRADIGHVAILHSAGMRGGFLVNGRENLHPILFPDELARATPSTTRNNQEEL